MFTLCLHRQETIAIVPLIIYIVGIFVSWAANYVEGKYGNKVHICIGICFGFFAHLLIGVGSCHSYAYTHIIIYVIAILMGFSVNMIKISAMSIVGEMIGHNRQSTSFVYAMVTLSEKTLTMVAIGVLEKLNVDVDDDVDNDSYRLRSVPSIDSQSLLSPKSPLLQSHAGSPFQILHDVNQQFCPNASSPSVEHYYDVNFLGSHLLLFIVTVGILLLTVRFKFE